MIRRHPFALAGLILVFLVASPGPVADALPAPRATAVRAPAYHATIRALPTRVRHLMKGSSWHRGCPVGLNDLRLIELRFWGFDRQAHRGVLVVHEHWAPKVARVFGKLYDARFPIRKMRLVDRYRANDMRSMKADNTSAFNCRYRNGVCCTWSEHAYGRAIDINPVENPYVGPWGVSPPKGARYRDRTPIRRGMLAKHDRAWWAFHAIGWAWGGQWSWPIDYQHYSATNR
jgi:D-alanyl-D-alanine carboxypeptidase